MQTCCGLQKELDRPCSVGFNCSDSTLQLPITCKSFYYIRINLQHHFISSFHEPFSLVTVAITTVSSYSIKKNEGQMRNIWNTSWNKQADKTESEAERRGRLQSADVLSVSTNSCYLSRFHFTAQKDDKETNEFLSFLSASSRQLPDNSMLCNQDFHLLNYNSEMMNCKSLQKYKAQWFSKLGK